MSAAPGPLAPVPPLPDAVPQRPAGSFTARAREATAEVRAAIDALAFLRELASGTLAVGSFAHYLEQDAIYLAGYARALALLSARAPDPEQSAFWARSAATAATAEGALHADLLADPALGAATRARGGERAEPSPTTLGYVSYLVATAATAPYPVAVAAVLPCFWVYADVGARLSAAASATSGGGDAHPYRQWVDAYGDPAFQAGARGACEVADACAAADAQQDAAMLAAFTTATRYELQFWRAAHAQERWPDPG